MIKQGCKIVVILECKNRFRVLLYSFRLIQSHDICNFAQDRTTL